MTLEAGKEMDRRCVMNWLNEVYVTPNRAFCDHTDDEIRIFAHDALVLLKEQEAVVRCKDCRHYTGKNCNYNDIFPAPREDWYCADGERRQKNE